MTKQTSEFMYWNDEWLAVKIGYSPITNQRIVHAQYKSNKEWYYGQADTIPEAIDAMEEKVMMLHRHGMGPRAARKPKENLGDIF